MSVVYKTCGACQVGFAHIQALAAHMWRHLCPPLCPLCRLSTTVPLGMCMACQSQLPMLDSNRCQRCAVSVPAGQTVCDACLRAPPAFDTMAVAYRYAAPIDQLICALKFSACLSHAPLLGSLLLQQLLQRRVEKPDCLLPVPLHHRRLRARGFNQSVEIARPIARYFKLPIVKNCITRVRAGAPQVSLSGHARRHSMGGAFAVHQPLQYHHVAIVDDVVTTATTVAELARRVRMAGAQRVSVWALARTD